MENGVILFPSTHFALQAEKVSKQEGLEVKLIPVPRNLSSDCGICLRFTWLQKSKIEKILDTANVRIEGIYSAD
jgi:hypothetical protein